MGAWLGAHPLLLVLLACGLDRWIGDPASCLHPVQVMGWAIAQLRRLAETWAGDSPMRLRLAGGVITTLVVGSSGAAGWALEQAATTSHGAGQCLALGLLVIALASSLAGRSLEQGVRAVLGQLPDLPAARRQLAWIVGRDTANLDGPAMLRALAETASENGVDGLFAPLFWMLLGCLLWSLHPGGVGPLSLAWGFKAASTLDSMLGYRRGRLQWLGTAGARLDDLLVWLPCRLVALSLPLAAGQGPARCWQVWRQARQQGAADPSPNAGVSQAAYALTARVQLGGCNSYGGQTTTKPLLGAGYPAPNGAAVERILQLNRRLELIWLAGASLTAACHAANPEAWASFVPFITKTLS